MTEEFHFHLFELTRAEGEVSRRDLVTKAFSDLGNAEGDLDPAGIADVLEVDEHPLSRLGPHECLGIIRANGPRMRFEHQVKIARFGQLTLVVFAWMLRRLERTFAGPDMIGSEAALTFTAIDQFVGEQIEVT